MSDALVSRWLTLVAGTLLTGLVAGQSLPAPYTWYRGEGNALDSGGGGHHGQEVNGIGYAPGRTGQAFSLDGVDDYISLSTLALPAGPAFSVEAWFRMESAFTASGPCAGSGCDQAIFSNQVQVNGNGWRILKQAGNQVWVLVNGSSATISTAGTVAAQTWTHVVATFDNWGAPGSSVSLYVNGAFAGSAGGYGTYSDIRIGGGPGGNGAFYGLIDEVKIYAAALSPAQVAAAFAASGTQAGSGPRDVALLDLDGDGDLDVATANETSDNVGLYVNDGLGALAIPSTASLTVADLGPVALARGDLDGDGARDDLAIACQGSSTLAYLTNPLGLATATSVAAGGLRPSSVASGALDANAIDDVVVGLQGELLAGGSGIAVVRNGGAPLLLTIPASYPTSVVRVALGDLDGDGDLDLAALAIGAPDQVLLFAGDGAGALTFSGALPLASSGFAAAMTLVDIDRDQRNDLVVVQPQLIPATQTLRIFRRTSVGALTPALFTQSADLATAGSFAQDLAAGDFDGDSIAAHLARVDLVHANVGGAGVTIRSGFTGSGFQGSASPAAGTNPIAVAVGDLDGDGNDDIAVANQGSDDVTIIVTAQPALAQVYGTGCGGPTISAVGTPLLGTPVFGVRVSGAVPVAPALLLYSAASADVALAPGACRLLVADPFISLLTFTGSAGTTTYTFGVPNLPALRGMDLYFQYAVIHSPGGAFADFVDLSDALRLQIGV